MTTPVTLADMIQPLTIADARTSVYAVLASLGVPTTSWKPNAVVKVCIEVLAILLAGASNVIVPVTQMGFREYATGDFETIRARGFYGLDRFSATFATGTVTLSNTAGGVYTIAPGDCIIQHDTLKTTYTNASAFTLGAGTIPTPTTVTIDVIATESGSASNATANVAMALVTTMTGVTVASNTAITGRDEETDDELKLREDASIDLLSPNGPAGAYLACASNALRADGSNVGVTRVAVTGPSGTGVLTVTVATATGAVSGTVGGAGTDLDYVNQYVQGAVAPGCVPLGVTATVVSATAHAINVTATLYVYTTDGRTKTELETAAGAIVAAWLPGRPINGDTGSYVYQSAIRAKLMSVSPYCFNAVVSSPASDEAISAGQVPTAGSMSITVSMVTP